MKRTFHVGPTLGVGMLHQILIIGHGKPTPNREDWAALCSAIAAEHAVARGQLVLSRGGVPDAAQRRAALAVLPPGFVAPPVAVLADQAVVRGIVTVLNWFLNDSHAAFKRTDLVAIAAHLRVDEEKARAIVAFAEELAPT